MSYFYFIIHLPQSYSLKVSWKLNPHDSLTHWIETIVLNYFIQTSKNHILHLILKNLKQSLSKSHFWNVCERLSIWIPLEPWMYELWQDRSRLLYPLINSGIQLFKTMCAADRSAYQQRLSPGAKTKSSGSLLIYGLYYFVIVFDRFLLAAFHSYFHHSFLKDDYFV